jgi:hypothetical protein
VHEGPGRLGWPEAREPTPLTAFINGRNEIFRLKPSVRGASTPSNAKLVSTFAERAL